MIEKFPTSKEISEQFKFDMQAYIHDVAILKFDVFADSSDPEATPASGNQAANSNVVAFPEPPEDLVA